MRNLTSVHCSPDTKKRLMTECVGIFKKYHPDFNSIKISERFIMEKVIERYIDG